MAHYVRARGAARDREAARAAAELRLAARNPAFGFQHVRTDPQLQPLHRSPEFEAVLRELAREHIARNRDAERLTEADLISLAQAQLTVEDATGALGTLERALAIGGGFRGVAAALQVHARALESAQREGTPP
jgi:ribonuclease D